MGKHMHFCYDEVYHRIGIGWQKTAHTMGKVWLPISQILPIQWVLLHFPMLWEIDGKTQTFPSISWDLLIFSCVLNCVTIRDHPQPTIISLPPPPQLPNNQPYFCPHHSPSTTSQILLPPPKTCHYKKKLYGPFLWMGFNCLKAWATLRRQFTFYH